MLVILFNIRRRKNLSSWGQIRWQIFLSFFMLMAMQKKALRVGLSEGFFFECIMCLGQKNS